jgi:DNA-binding MarR family transcriptional regulator
MPSDQKDIHLPNLEDVDKVIHESARLIIMSYLYLVESADFLFIMQQTGLTFGNLSSHMKKLEEAGYIEVLKEFVDRRPRTTLKLTPAGHNAFKEYREKMRLWLDQTDS